LRQRSKRALSSKASWRVTAEPVTVEQLAAARHAFLSFGKGHHPAALNFGDGFSYALSKTTGETLLFQGDDFAPTDASRAG
jgi:ribonuclease VapC